MLTKTELKMGYMTFDAGSFWRVLQPPEISLMEILMRESIQNSLDASIPKGKDAIRVDFDLVSFDSTKDLGARVASAIDPELKDPVVKRLLERINSSDPTILTIKDSGTTGLSGPIRMDDPEYFNTEKRNNFDNLVSQIGRNHGTEGAGGSYGFGKTIFYRLSDVGLVLFYSRCEEGERLAFFMVSRDEARDIRTSTGLCYWGGQYKYDNALHPCPIERSKEIEFILKKLGIGDKRFAPDETGTLIAIVGPLLSNLVGEDPDQEPDSLEERTFDAARNAAIKWYWPRMIRTNEVKPKAKIRPLIFSMRNEVVTLPIGMKTLGQQLLLTAEAVNAGAEVPEFPLIKHRQIKTVNYGRIHLGTLSFTALPESPDQTIFPGNSIAMLRSPRMIVYHQSVAGRSGEVVLGLFLLRSETKVQPNKERTDKADLQSLDFVFKKCESATHSEWHYQALPSNESWFKTYVKFTKENISKEVINFFNSKEKLDRGIERSRAAKALGNILKVIGGRKKTLRGGSGRGTTPANRKPRVKVLETSMTGEDAILLKMRATNLRPGGYLVPVEISNKSATYDFERWAEDLHGDFPVEILNCSKPGNSHLKINVEKHRLHIEASDTVSQNEDFFIMIKALKRDVLVQFGIKKTS